MTLNPKHLEGISPDREAAAAVARELSRSGDFLAFDTETVGWSPDDKVTPLYNARIACFSISDGRDSWCFDATCLDVFKPLLEQPDVDWFMANPKFDAAALHNHGIHFGGRWWDVVVMAKYDDISQDRFGLKPYLTRRYLGIDAKEFGAGDFGLPKNRKPTTEGLIEADPYLFADYSRDDARLTWQVGEKLRQTLQAAPWYGEHNQWDLYAAFDEPLTHVLHRMEVRGVRINQDKLKIIRGKIEIELGELQDWFDKLTGREFNPQSTDQIEWLLYTKLGLSPEVFTNTKRCSLCGKKATKATNYSCKQHGVVALTPVAKTDHDVLEEMHSRHVEAGTRLLRHRKINQIWKTFLPHLMKVQPDDKVHTTLVQAGASTFRFASRAPNLQNISRPDKDDPNSDDPIERGFGLRECIEPDPGYDLVVVDQSQIELRLGAHLSGDENMIAAFLAGRDLHAETAKAVFDNVADCPVEEVKKRFPAERSLSKNVNFGVFYGMGVKRCMRLAGCGPNKAKLILARFFERYPGVKAYRDVIERRCQERGHLIGLLGHRRPFPFIRKVANTPQLWSRYINGDDDLRARYSSEVRTAGNWGCQHGGACVINTCMLILDGVGVPWHPYRQTREFLDLGGEQLLQVHDEIIAQAPEGTSQEVLRVMLGVMKDPIPKLRVPLYGEGSVGKTWAEAKG